MSALLFVGIVCGQELNKNVLDRIVAESEKTNTDALVIYQNGNIVYKNYFGGKLPQNPE